MNNPKSNDERVNRYVRCVASAVTAEAPGSHAWEVRVFESAQVNAFALPGGKIGVYTGILKVAENQHQLAAILGHEVAHVTAEHGNARVSAAYATQASLQVTQVLVGPSTPQKQQALALLGLGAQYGVLMPYGRRQETEADLIGLEIMAKAGFDPREAVGLWRNMSKAAQGRQPPVLLSTHPSHEGRIKALESKMPAALDLQQEARQKGKMPDCKR